MWSFQSIHVSVAVGSTAVPHRSYSSDAHKFLLCGWKGVWTILIMRNHSFPSGWGITWNHGISMSLVTWKAFQPFGITNDLPNISLHCRHEGKEQQALTTKEYFRLIGRTLATPFLLSSTSSFSLKALGTSTKYRNIWLIIRNYI